MNRLFAIAREKRLKEANVDSNAFAVALHF